MDVIGTASSLLNTAGQAYSDFQRGREARLGQYQGHENIKKMGHYNAKTGKKLAIYHG
jgi:hypothetical protein